MASEVVVRTNTRPIAWGPAIGASIVAGVVFAVIEMALAWAVKGLSPWAPLHMIGAIGLGPGALTPPDTFDLGIVSTAVVIHLALAILYGIILALIVQRLDATWAVIAGGFYGLALYFINFYGFTRLFPWFAEARDWVSILSHFVQSALMAGLYKSMTVPGVARRGTERRIGERRIELYGAAVDAGAERRIGERRMQGGTYDLRHVRNVPLR
jgi:hypothetical protein